MTMRPPTGVLVWVFLSIQFTCCSSIPVTKFIEYPFNAQRIFPSNDDNFLTVGFRQSVMVNRTNYTAVHINNNGVLSFRAPNTKHAPRTFPINGNEYIAPFWTDIDTRGCPEITNTVFYQEFTSNNSNSLRAFKTINKMVESSTDFRALSGCAKVSFRTRWAFAVTWREVRYYDETCDKYNDFQIVLATDGTLTFAIMNYARVDVGSRPPMVGVNAGDGANFRTHPDAMRDNIYNIESEPGNTGELGQWVYRVDVIGTRVRISWRTHYSYIRLVPSVGTIFGGTAVRIVYPCVHYPRDIICIFGNSEVYGIYLRSEQQFLCVTPEFRDHTVGKVPFRLTFIDYYYRRIRRITLRSSFYKNFFDRHVSFNAEQMLVPFGRNVTVTWKPSFLSVRNSQAYKVNIELYEFLIDGSLKYISTPVTNANNSGLAALVLPKFKTSAAISLTFFKITPAHFHKRFKRGSNSGGGVPKEWYAIIEEAYNPDFECMNWQSSEPDGSKLLNLVEPCPLTENQVMAVNSNFDLVDSKTQPCFGFDIEKLLDREFYPHEANVCFLQRTLRPRTTAGNHCCYKNGSLCTHKGCGGTVNKVAPTESCKEHYINDILPALNKCSSYLDKRPIDNGSRYAPPPPTCVGCGDPHIATLDGHWYTFNGRGEFTLIETQKQNQKFTVQGRMIRATGPGLTATVFSAIVAKETNSDTVQIELDPFGELVALVNGEEVSFDELSTFKCRNVAVSNHGGQTISATFACGAYIKVKKEIGHSIRILGSLSKTFRGLTHGLMGNYNGDTSDDLIPKGSTTPISLESTLQVIHEQFGITWIIRDPRKSLFAYHGNQSWADYYDPLFSPVFQPMFSDPQLEANARRICNGDSFCLFDIAVTNRLDIGMSTLHERQNHNRTVEFSLPIVCKPKCGHGLCVENDTCSCDLGYKGKFCNESDAGPCRVNTCLNGGYCYRWSYKHFCDCRGSYTGDRCETAFAVPYLSVLRYFSLGVLIRWRAYTTHTIEMFRFTVFDITSNNSTVLNLEFSTRTSAYFFRPIRGHQYFVQVEARVGDRYENSRPGTVKFTY